MIYRMMLKLDQDLTTHGLAEAVRKAADQIEEMSSIQAAHSMKINADGAKGDHGTGPAGRG